ncbi:MAG: hypothetical protein RR357_03840 [Clostridia bacterium]
MNLSQLTSTQLSQLSLAITELMTTGCTVADYEILLLMLSIIRDKVALDLYKLRNCKKS